MSANKITAKNILNHGKNKNKITLENILQESTIDNVSDAMKNVCGKSGVISGIKPINEYFEVIGQIRTAYTNSSDWGTCIDAIYQCNPDEILLIQTSDDKTAVWGELASLAAKKQGIKATVIYGASRDTREVLELEFPLFSTKTMPNAGYPLNNGQVNERLNINGNIIVNGDYLIGNYEGVVIIPKEKLDEVLDELNNLKKFEKKLIKELNNDKSLKELLDIS